MLFNVAAVFLFYMGFADSISLHLCENATKGSSCRLKCSTPDVNKPILFTKLPTSGGHEGGCSNGTCGTTNENPRYKVSQNSLLNETYLDIHSLVYVEDNFQWRCEYGSDHSIGEDLTVVTVPSTVQFTPDPTSGDFPQNLTGKFYCVYPVSSLTTKLIFDDGQHSLDMSNEVSHTNGTDGCDPHEYTVIRYCQLNRTSLVGKTVQFQIEARIIDQKIVSNSTSQWFDFPEPPTVVGLSTGLLILSCNYVLAYAITGIVLLTCCKPLWNKRFDLVIAYIVVGVTGLGCVVAGYMLSDTVNEDSSLALTIVGLVISLVSLSIVIAIIVFVIKSKQDKRDGSLTQAVNKGLLDMTPVSNEQ